jgi:signal transduction histidine kinase/DNA-binding response OmpR family regulator
MWFGTVYDGLYLLEKGKFDFLHCQLPVTGQVHVYDIFEDSRGELWVATNKGLMQRKKGGDPPTRFYQDTNWPGLHETSILCIYEDHKENLWIGTAIQAYGLFRQPPEYRGTSTFLQYKHDPGDDLSLSNDWVWCVQEDPFNNLWIATENGLNKYIRDKDYFERHINPTDQGANFIYDLSGDNNGYLWMATESGLVRYNPEMDIQNAGTTNNYKQFLAHRDIMCYHIYKSQSGKMFVGSVRLGENGYFSFHPDSLFENQQPPPVVITQFMVHNKVVESDSSIQFKKQIRLNYNQNFFSFEFAALDYYNPSQNEYAYILHGFDNDWTYSGNQRLARYTKVPPGKYIFQVKGSNSNGYWNEEGASIAISILPPPWKTWWAYSLYGIFLIGLFYLWRWYDLKRQKLRQELELEHVEAEKLKELDTMKSRFFANISHEFRTPLTLILGPLEKIRTQITDEAQKDLDIMHRNARRLQILINQLLSLSKLESGQMKLHTREENIVALVNGYIQSFESLAKQKNIDLSFTSLEKKVQLFVDKEKMEKILSNLLSNALKFTGEGGRIEVTVSSQQIEDLPGKWVRLIVSDTGRGILPDKLEHIFDRFYQADDSYTKDQEGTGIGLALTQELVELHHGKITVESESDKGTTLTVLLPLGKEHLKPEEIEDTDSDWDGEFVDWEDPGEQIVESGIHESLPDEDPEKEGSKPLLLIVEDNDDLRLYIRSYLAKDYSISEAIDGEMGLEKAIKNIPDLVISDVMMPKMDGYQLCRKLKTDERTSHIPVILLTAKASMEDKLEGLETGADDFLIKPFDQQELLLRIKNLIHQRRKLQQLFAGNISSIGELSDISITSMDKIFIQKSIEVVEKNISDANFSMEQFGQGMNMSRMQLHRKMRALVDQSPGEFIRTIRLNWAAILLKEKTANIAEIAYDVGFSNPSYFSECFRNQFGKLPSEYSD